MYQPCSRRAACHGGWVSKLQNYKSYYSQRRSLTRSGNENIVHCLEPAWWRWQRTIRKAARNRLRHIHPKGHRGTGRLNLLPQVLKVSQTMYGEPPNFDQDIGDCPGPWRYKSPCNINQQHQVLSHVLHSYNINLDAMKGLWSPYAATSLRSESIIIIQFSCPHKLPNCCRVEYQLLKSKKGKILVGKWNITKHNYFRPQPLHYLADMLLAGDEPSFFKLYLSQNHSCYDTSLNLIRKPKSYISFQRLNLTNNTCSRGN